MEDLLHIPRHRAPLGSDAMDIEISKDIEELRVLDNRKRPVSSGNPQGDLHAMLGLGVLRAACESGHGSGFGGVLCWAFFHMAAKIARAVVMSSTGNRHRWAPKI